MASAGGDEHTQAERSHLERRDESQAPGCKGAA